MSSLELETLSEIVIMCVDSVTTHGERQGND